MSSLEQTGGKIKSRWAVWVLVLIVILTSSLSFGLGRLSRIQAKREPISIEYPATDLITNNTGSESVKGDTNEQGRGVVKQTAAVVSTAPPVVPIVAPAATIGAYVGSRTSDKYHLPWCAGAKRIKPENQIWFATKAEAERAGYTPAGNCPGI